MNLKVFVILFLFFLINFSLTGQERDRKADSLIYEITVNLASQNPTRAHYLADSLFLHTSFPHYKLQALLASAEVYKKEGRTTDMLEKVLKALNTAKKEKNYDIQSKIYGYLSTISRQVGFFEEGKYYLEKGIESISKTEDPAIIEAFKAMANAEIAEFEMEMGNFTEAIRFINLSRAYYKNHEDDQRAQFLISRLEEVRGRCYMALNNPEKALLAFRSSRKFLHDSATDNSLFSALIFQGLGETHLVLKELDSAHHFLTRALIIAEPSSYDPIKEEIYGSLASYYAAAGIADSASIYSKKFREISKAIAQSKKLLINDLTQSLPSDNSSLPSDYSKKWWILGGGLFLILGGAFIFANPAFRTKSSPDKIPQEDSKVKLSEDMERKFDERLKTFENSQKFLDPNMCLASLISYLDTNAKYLNHYLKTYRQKDYNTYINDLRIHYIVQRIDNNKKYRKYKISHLAKESGFSSHSNFSANFKRVMELAPSDYLEKIKTTF